jgi:Flp pilus assembly protein CpaB
MNLIIIAIGALVVTSLVAMLAIDISEEQKEQERAEIRETELQQLQSSFEAKEKKNVIFLNLGEEM